MAVVATQVEARIAEPFLKWAGGKRQLLPELRKVTAGHFRHYYEPFLGGGALYFDLRALGWQGAATLGDSNERLVRTYMGVRNDVEAVIEGLKDMRYNKKEYLEERARHWDILHDDPDFAIRFIYLNRCGFNGMYRENKKGEFNIPFGRYTNPTICDTEGLRAASKALKRTEFRMGDFEKTVRGAEQGDLVYFDPPYVPINETSDFTGYTRDGFTLDDQTRLRDCALKLKKRGVRVVLSNVDLPIVRKLYKGFTLRAVRARRNINSKGERRGDVGELIIT